jgi:hypothetical protein
MTTGTLKVCSICREELDGKKRFKDADGTYFCPACWGVRNEIAGAPAAPARSIPTSLPAAARPAPAAPALPGVAHTPAAPAKIALQKLGFFAVGIGAVAFFDLWPIYQANTNTPQLSLSLKGILIGWMAFCVSLVAMLPERIGITWTRPPGQVASAAETQRIKVILGVAVGLGFAMSIATDLYIQHLGYTIHF